MNKQLTASKINILAFDASTEALSLVLNYNGQLFHHFEECPQQHSQKILPLVDALLAKANCKLTDCAGPRLCVQTAAGWSIYAADDGATSVSANRGYECF